FDILKEWLSMFDRIRSDRNILFHSLNILESYEKSEFTSLSKKKSKSKFATPNPDWVLNPVSITSSPNLGNLIHLSCEIVQFPLKSLSQSTIKNFKNFDFISSNQSSTPKNNLSINQSVCSKCNSRCASFFASNLKSLFAELGYNSSDSKSPNNFSGSFSINIYPQWDHYLVSKTLDNPNLNVSQLSARNNASSLANSSLDSNLFAFQNGNRKLKIFPEISAESLKPLLEGNDTTFVLIATCFSFNKKSG
ncbi:hypothetical protein BB560_005651, partial [Smittium megazygosporum]